MIIRSAGGLKDDVILDVSVLTRMSCCESVLQLSNSVVCFESW